MKTQGETISFDARAIISAGEEPLQQILEAAARVQEGGVLELTAPFEPVPLYSVMSQRGFGYRSERITNDEWHVNFHQLGITYASILFELQQHYPSTASVLLSHGLDLCCGSGKSLLAAASAHGIRPELLLAEVQQAALP